MRARLGTWVLLLLLGCAEKLDEKERIAQVADLQVRQLIAGLNAQNKEVLGTLLVLTSTTGGPPRALRPDELALLVNPEPPFEYLGPGKPGTMLLRDGKQEKRVVELVRVGEGLRVLARREALSSYLSRETGQGSLAGPVQVISFLPRQPE